MISRFSFCSLLLSLLSLTAVPVLAGTVNVGLGGYSTDLPAGEVGPQNAWSANVSPKVSPKVHCHRVRSIACGIAIAEGLAIA